MESLTVLTALTLFLVKHTLADYFLQFSWMMKDKAIYGAKGGIAHAGLHGVLTSLVLLVMGLPIMAGIVLGLIDFIIHYHIDFIKSNLWKSKNLKATDQMFWIIHGVDQMLHGLTYIFIIWIVLRMASGQ